MHLSKLSMVLFGIYLASVGLTLITIPNFMLPLFGFDQVTDVWIRLLGLVFTIVAGIYYLAIRENWLVFYKYTAGARLVICLFTVFCVASGLAPWPLLLFGVVDAVSGIVTYVTTRNFEKEMEIKSSMELA